MSFFRKKAKESFIKVHAISPGSLTRKVIYDSGCRYPEDVAELMGLSRVSEDVAEMEEYASEARIDRLSPIFSIIESHSAIAAQVNAFSYLRSTQDENDEAPDEEVIFALIQMFKTVSHSATVSCLASLLDLNLFKEGYTNV
jgi:hypothetical protein